MEQKINVRIDGQEVTIYLDSVEIELNGKLIPKEIVDEYGNDVSRRSKLWRKTEKHLVDNLHQVLREI